MTFNAQRAVDELRELRRLTENDEGAQRVAWTDPWLRARQWPDEKFQGLPIESETDEAGNRWWTLRGESERALAIGGHLDSVPNGGWLDGALNIVAGSAIVRRLARQGRPPITVRLVDWADEEGARFGRSLFGSSAASGSLNPKDLVGLTDREGIRLPDALARCGVELARVGDARGQLEQLVAYLELHIEQGPVLESLKLPLAAVLGTVGIKRHAIRFVGQSAHAGTTPMDLRRDALMCASRLHIEIAKIAKRHNGVGTIGRIAVKPGVSSAVVGECELLLEQRHLEASSLDAMVEEAKAASDQIASEERVASEWNRIWEIPPMVFDRDLVSLADEAISETVGTSHRMPSGALHDASEMARVGIPTAMMFVQSLRGLSHTKEEDTTDEHLRVCLEAFDKLVSKTIAKLTLS